jgi:hypothetical protein
MIEVYLLEHLRTDPEGEHLKIIGVFSSKQMAEQAIAQLRQKPGFIDYLDGFNIDRYIVDKVFWGDGFG